MNWIVVSSESLETERAVQSVLATLVDRLAGDTPRALLIFQSARLDADRVRQVFSSTWPGVALHGSTSCRGALTPEGADGGLVATAIVDPDGDYGAACVSHGEDARMAATSATLAALRAAGRTAETPELIWVGGTPGQEELVLRGIQDVVGAHVPIIGGSAADDTITGRWRVFDAHTVCPSGTVVLVCFPAGPVGFAFRSGYEPTDHSALITRASGRTILTLDGRPSAQVYNAWVNSQLGAAAVGQNILADTTMRPLGRACGEIQGVPEYLLIHPAVVSAGEGLTCFADVLEGTRLTLMTGCVESLVTRIGRVAQDALVLAGLTADRVAGALVVYCGGCRLAVDARVSEVSEELRRVLPGVPFAGTFTFGEQGALSDGTSCHGNLMISVVVFGHA